MQIPARHVGLVASGLVAMALAADPPTTRMPERLNGIVRVTAAVCPARFRGVFHREPFRTNAHDGALATCAPSVERDRIPERWGHMVLRPGGSSAVVAGEVAGLDLDGRLEDGELRAQRAQCALAVSDVGALLSGQSNRGLAVHPRCPPVA